MKRLTTKRTGMTVGAARLVTALSVVGVITTGARTHALAISVAPPPQGGMTVDAEDPAPLPPGAVDPTKAQAPLTGAAFAKERSSLTWKLETLRHILPDRPETEQDLGIIRRLATLESLAQTELRPRPAVETGTEAHVPVEVSGEGTDAQILGFFERVHRLARLITVEGLERSARSGDRHHFAGVLRLHYWPTAAPVPPAPAVLIDDTPVSVVTSAGAPAEAVEAFRRDRALFVAKVQIIQRLKGHMDESIEGMRTEASPSPAR